MPPKKGKTGRSQFPSTESTVNPTDSGSRRKNRKISTVSSDRHNRTTVGIRSRSSAAFSTAFEDNPESTLRKPRKPRRAKGTAESQPRPNKTVLEPVESPIVPSLIEEYQHSEYNSPNDHYDQGVPLPIQGLDPENIFSRQWGYLPPLDEEAVAVIDAVIANPNMAKEYSRIGPENKLFPEGLSFRNVILTESVILDPVIDQIKRQALEESVRETEQERESHGQLWMLDQAKCEQGSNEALFQRTLMMALILRHRLIYKTNVNVPRCLGFSVEELWTCALMLSRAYKRRLKFLTQPKPDLAVCFCRKAVIADHLWNDMPRATRGLACFENMSEFGARRIFHFCTVEAKKGFISADDTIGKRQSLNNASQALHNMFEFFRDAGPQHEKHFFTEVRFFSVVASTEGLTIRIHRATREPEDGSDQGFIMPDRPDYPLRFEYREFFKFQKDSFHRDKILETFEKILFGYGIKTLLSLLQDAAKAIMQRLNGNLEETNLRDGEDFYRYGQTAIMSSSRKQTPLASQATSETSMSFEMLQSRKITPMQHQPSVHASSSSRKRLGQPHDSGRERNTRQRTQ